MAKDPLEDASLHFDDLNKLRVLEPEVSQQTTELKEECKDFVDSKCIRVIIVVLRPDFRLAVTIYVRSRLIISPLNIVIAFLSFGKNRNWTVPENSWRSHRTG